MKNGILFAVMVLLCMTGLSSCDLVSLRDETTNEVKWKSLEICATEWTKCSDAKGLNTYYKYSTRISELNYDVLKGGIVQCFLYDGDTQVALPDSRHYEDEKGNRWTRTIDFEVYSGGISIYVTDNDFSGEAPGTLRFRLTLLL